MRRKRGKKYKQLAATVLIFRDRTSFIAGLLRLSLGARVAICARLRGDPDPDHPRWMGPGRAAFYAVVVVVVIAEPDRR